MNYIFLNHNYEFFGTYFRCLNIAKNLSDYGHYVTIICASNKKFDLTIKSKLLRKNLKIITLPRIAYGKYFSGQILRLLLTLLYLIFKKYDVLYAFTIAQPQIAWPAYFSKKILKKKLIIDWDDLWGGGFGKLHNNIIDYILGFHERYFIQFADKITFTSNYLKKKIDQKISNKILKKIPNGCYPNNYKILNTIKARRILKIDKNKKIFMLIGNTYTEGLITTLKAFNNIIKTGKNKNLYMYFVGIKKLDKEFSEYLKPIEKRIVFVGNVPFNKISTFMSAANTLVLPMGNNPIEKARFPIRFADYLCSTKPMVSNAVGEIQDYLKRFKCGFFVKNKDYRGMGIALVKSLKNNNYNKSLCKNAKKLANGKLNNKKILNSLNNFLTFKI